MAIDKIWVLADAGEAWSEAVTRVLKELRAKAGESEALFTA